MTIRTVTASGVTEVNFNSDGTKPYFYSSEKYCWIKNLSDADMYASLDSACTAGAAGTALISAGECVLIELSPANKVYVSGSGNAEIHTRDSAECPFKKPQKGGDVLPKYAGGYSGFIDINRNNSEDMYSRLNSLPFITNTGEDLSLEFCMKVLSGRTHAGRYLDFDNGTFVIADEYSDGHYYLKIKCSGEWRLTEGSHIEIPQDVNFTLSVVIGSENTQIFIHKENGDSNFYAYRWLDSSMLDDLTSGNTYFFDSTVSDRHVDGKLYAFRKYRRALTQAEITKNHQEDMRLVAMANRLEIIKQPEDVSANVDETITFNVEAIGENLAYKWELLKPGTTEWVDSSVPGYNTAKITVQTYDYRNGYSYRCIISSGNNRIVSNPGMLVITNNSKNNESKYIPEEYEDYDDLKSDNDERTKVKEIDDLWK